MDEFPSNSRRATERSPTRRDENKKVERIVEGEVIRKKRSLGKRFRETFGGGDAKGVWEYIVIDVLIPAAKDMFADAASQGVERMIFGDVRSSRSRNRGRGRGDNGYVAYNRFGPSGSRREESRPQLSRRARTLHDFDEIILPTRVEAEEVVDQLFELISKYEIATVADLYQLVGITGSYTDDKWGWSDIRGAGVTRMRNGYLLDLPKPEPLD